MKIVLKKFITREYLADRVGISSSTLSRKLKEAKKAVGLKEKKRDLLTSREVNAFFNYYQLDPNCLGNEVVDIHEYPEKSLAPNCQIGKRSPT